MTGAHSPSEGSIIGVIDRSISEIPSIPHQIRSGFSYVPAVVLKPAEATALDTLQGGIANDVYPLIIARAIPPVRTDTNEETGIREPKPQPTLAEHVQSQQNMILRALGVQQQLFNSGVTRVMLDADGLDRQQERATLGVFRRALGDECRHVVPVLGFERGENNRLAAEWDRDYFTGVAFRITTLATAPRRSAAEILTLLVDLGIKANRVDLILDAGEVGEQNIDALVAIAVTFHSSVARAARWRSVILIANGFPRSISSLPFNISHRLVRWDLVFWKRVRYALWEDHCGQLPIFGDYGMVHGATAEGGRMPQPNIRYTEERYWLVHRREQDEQAMFEVCGVVVEGDSFCGDSFSEGDAWIKRCADGSQRGSNAQTWLRAGWQHHIAFVVAQLRGRT